MAMTDKRTFIQAESLLVWAIKLQLAVDAFLAQQSLVESDLDALGHWIDVLDELWAKLEKSRKPNDLSDTEKMVLGLVPISYMGQQRIIWVTGLAISLERVCGGKPIEPNERKKLEKFALTLRDRCQP